MNGRSIQICTGARLHFGLILGTETTGWVFGGVGLMLQQPGWQLSLQPAEHSGAGQTAQDRVLGSPEAVTRVTTLLQRLRAAACARLGLLVPVRPVDWNRWNRLKRMACCRAGSPSIVTSASPQNLSSSWR